MRRLAILLVVSPVLFACASETAQAPPMAGVPARVVGRSITTNDVANKLVFVNRLLEDSPLALRVTQRGDPTARRQIADARRLLSRATRSYDSGDLRRADGFLDDALGLITAASRAVPERERTLAAQRARYQELLRSIETFRSWNERVAARKANVGDQPSSVALDADRTRTMIKGAEALERADDLAGANKLLAEAEAQITWTLNQLVANEVLVYRLDFATPSDEYRYERDRYASYEELLPVAVGALTPSAEAGERADRLFGEAEALRRDAETRAASGAHDQAVVLMRDAVRRLQLAFEGFGVVVPQQLPQEP